MAERLLNQPLSEAIFEIHWTDSEGKLEVGTQPLKLPLGQVQVSPKSVDKFHKIFLGRIFDQLMQKYPHRTDLPSSSIPDEYAGHVVQYQFWKAPDQWPVVQIGPGVLSVNDTTNYDWEDFYRRSIGITELLTKLHPSLESIRMEKLVLRYTNAIEFDFTSNDGLEFLQQKMHTEIKFPSELFQSSGIQTKSEAFNIRTSFRTEAPCGIVTIAFITAMRNGDEPAIYWENQVISSGTDLPSSFEDIGSWLSDAHKVAEHCFKSFTSGDLERSFNQ